jgi:tetratricopeptide (TPR) repeat protein
MGKLYLVVFSLFACTFLRAQSQNEFFTALGKVPGKERPDMAQTFYYEKLSSSPDSLNVLYSLQRLVNWARTKDDALLETNAWILLADYHRHHHASDTASAYLERALKQASQLNGQPEIAQIYNMMAWIFYRQKKYPQTFEYILKACNIIETKIGAANYRYASRNYYDMGYMYFDFGNATKSKACLLKALQYPFASKTDQLGTYNTLGMIYQVKKEYDSAVYFFEKTIAVARTIHHEAWVGIATGNLGSIYYEKQQYDKALPYLEADYRISTKNKETMSAGNALVAIADINLIRNNLALAGKQLDDVKKILDGYSNDALRYEYLLKRALLYRKLNQYDKAFFALDSARVIESSIIMRNSAATFSQAEQKIEVEQHIAQVNYLQSEKSKSVLIRNFIIVTFLLLLVIAALLIVRQKQKQKMSQQLLDNASLQLNNYLESIREKNQLIENFQAEIKQLHEHPYESFTIAREREEMAEKLKHYTILTDDHWNEFRHLFEKVHVGFFDILKEIYPSLTQSEIRLLALVKLNLSRKEMAEMLGISPDSIKKTRQRIRKKIELPEEMDLEEMVKHIYN